MRPRSQDSWLQNLGCSADLIWLPHPLVSKSQQAGIHRSMSAIEGVSKITIAEVHAFRRGKHKMKRAGQELKSSLKGRFLICQA